MMISAFKSVNPLTYVDVKQHVHDFVAASDFFSFSFFFRSFFFVFSCLLVVLIDCFRLGAEGACISRENEFFFLLLFWAKKKKIVCEGERREGKKDCPWAPVCLHDFTDERAFVASLQSCRGKFGGL